MAWYLLVLAGLLEIGWAIGLKYTEGFIRLTPSVITFTVATASFILLGIAVRDLPVGTAYAIWTAIGTALLGILLFGEPATAGRLLCIGLIVAGVAGLKLIPSA